MKKLLTVLFIVMGLALLVSCGAKTVNVQVVDANGNTICDEFVPLGEENEYSILGVTTFGIDCLEAALKQAGIEYYINKEDYEAFAVTNIGDIACDNAHTFKYMVKAKRESEYQDKTGLSAQHDYVAAGDSLKFVYSIIES